MERSNNRLRKFKRYPEYRDSGVEWLGEIPEHWELQRIKRLGSLQGGAGFPHVEQGVEGELLPFFKVGDMIRSSDGKYLVNATNSVSQETALSLGAFVFPPNTVVFAKVGAALLLNRRRLLTRPSCVDNNMMGFIPSKCDPEWSYYWLSGLNLGELANPGAVPSVNEGQIRDTPVSIPNLSEQRAIATFLDRETARIDALIAKKEMLIELLQEKRTALIAHAVTKGLDPDVPMKDSGVEWLGEMAGHWRTKRIKYMVSFTGGGTPAKEDPSYWRGDIPWASPKDMKSEEIDSTEDYITETGLKESSTHLAQTGSVLIVVRSGILKHTIPVAINKREVALNQDMKALTPSAELNPEFLKFLILGCQKPFLAIWRKQGATVESLEHELVANTSIPVPPPIEQEKIVVSLNFESKMINRLLAKVRVAIHHLKEYRTALISAAVTGKIDVRDQV